MHYNALTAKGIILSPITSCSTKDHSVAAAFTEYGIGREEGDGSAQRGWSVIYDCLVSVGSGPWALLLKLGSFFPSKMWQT